MGSIGTCDEWKAADFSCRKPRNNKTAIIATILISAGVDPSYAIGCGKVRGLGRPYFGRGDYFIAEADEYVTDPTHDPTPGFFGKLPRFWL